MQAFNAKIVEAASKGGAYIEIPFNVEEVYGASESKLRQLLMELNTAVH